MGEALGGLMRRELSLVAFQVAATEQPKGDVFDSESPRAQCTGSQPYVKYLVEHHSSEIMKHPNSKVTGIT